MSEPLSPDQVATLEAELKRVEAELRELLERAADDARPVDLDLPIGRLTRIDAIQQQQMAKAGRRDLERRLTLVEAALRRAGRDELGECTGCGGPIGWARLSARPESHLCLDCQSERESRA